MISRNKVRPSQEKVNVMIAFYKILTAKKKTISLKWAFTHTGSLWDSGGILSKCYNAEGFFRPLPIRTYVSNKCLLHFSGFPHIPLTERQWRKLVPERRVSSQLRKTLTLSKKRSRMLWLCRIDGGDMGEPNCFKWEKSARLGGWP